MAQKGERRLRNYEERVVKEAERSIKKRAAQEVEKAEEEGKDDKRVRFDASQEDTRASDKEMTDAELQGTAQQ